MTASLDEFPIPAIVSGDELIRSLEENFPPPRTCRLLHGRQAFDRLTPSWYELLRTTSSTEFYHLPEWFSALLPRFDDSQILFYVEERLHNTTAIVPLIRSTYRFAGIPLQSIELLNNGLTPFCDYVVASDEDANGIRLRLTQALKSARIPWDLLVLPNVVAHSHAARDMNSATAGMQIVQEKRLCDYFTSMPYERRLTTFSDNFRGNLRKARNKLNAETSVRYEWHRKLEDVRQAFPEFLKVEASGWKADAGTSIAQDPQAREFYERLIEQFAPQENCGIHLLKLNEQTIAAQFALFQGPVCSLIKIGYDESFHRLAPGNMLLEALLRKYEASTEIREINLISGMEWHKSWKPQVAQVHNYFQFNLTSRALLAYSLYQGKSWTGQVRKSIESPTNNLIPSPQP